jgi:hypothetical protein
MKNSLGMSAKVILLTTVKKKFSWETGSFKILAVYTQAARFPQIFK